MRKIYITSIILLLFFVANSQKNEIPDTGISGLYEVMMGVEDLDYAIKYFGEFGFTVRDSSEMSKEDAEKIYGHASAFKSYRLQNGNIDSHGLLRLFKWDTPKSMGVGYVPPETIGQRMAVMKTEDIFRIYDTFQAAREAGGKWLPTYPISDDLFGLDDGKKSIFNRPVAVREMATYGEFFVHVFFQRYGYNIPGYGTINKESNLKTSEFTHHDFIISAPSMENISYLSSALGLKAEKEPKIDGDWLKGPKSVFMMKDGDSHWYQGFVSPNNICGKLKFFIPIGNKLDKSADQVVGAIGISLHSFYTAKLEMVHKLVTEHGLNPTEIQKNEFGEESFLFTGPAGCSWQIIKKSKTNNIPTTELNFELTKG